MTYPLGDFRTYKGKDRLHEPLFVMQVIFESVGRAQYLVLKGAPIQTSPGETWDFACYQFRDVEVRTPIHGPLEFAMKNEVPQSTGFGVVAVGPKTDMGPLITVIPFYTQMLLPFFVEFYEKYVLWLRANVDAREFTKWPMVWQFAMVVRNAASHGGKINLKDATIPPRTWYNLSYSTADYGREPFKTDLFIGDLLILMKEMSEALDALGCRE
jgi:hypothetical protein